MIANCGIPIKRYKLYICIWAAHLMDNTEK